MGSNVVKAVIEAPATWAEERCDIYDGAYVTRMSRCDTGTRPVGISDVL